MSDVSNTIKNGLILLLGVLVIILFVKGCADNSISDITKPEVISTKVEKDSIRTHYTHTTDTIVKWYPKVVTKLILDTSKTLSHPNDGYYYTQKDSLLEYTIKVNSSTQPDSVGIDYKVLQSTITDSIFIRDSIFVKQTDKVRVNQLYFGGDVVAYPTFNAAFAGIDLVSKKGWQLEGAVGISEGAKFPLVRVGVKKLITFRKKK